VINNKLNETYLEVEVQLLFYWTTGFNEMNILSYQMTKQTFRAYIIMQNATMAYTYGRGNRVGIKPSCPVAVE
jgi:hypothetical protein